MNDKVVLNDEQGYIFCKILWLVGGRGNGAGEKNEKWGSEEKEEKRGKEKEEKEKGRVIFFVNIWHTFVDNCIST